jgi:hypothetical protein
MHAPNCNQWTGTLTALNTFDFSRPVANRPEQSRSRNKFTTVQLPFESFTPVHRKADYDDNNRYGKRRWFVLNHLIGDVKTSFCQSEVHVLLQNK